MDVGEVLRTGRERAGLSQARLAALGGTSRQTVGDYEAGKKSPTVRTLDRLLAACGLQLRVALEPLQAQLDARVAAYTSDVPAALDGPWATFADVLDDVAAPSGVWRPVREGPVTWAVDGAAALALHGFAAPVESMTCEVVVQLDEALRYWMKAVMLRGVHEDGSLEMSWFDLDLEEMTAVLRGARDGLGGYYRVRVVAELGPTLTVSVPWSERPIRVATVDEVERAHPEHAEVLQRWRETRSRDVA